MLGSTYLEHVRDAEVEHVVGGRMYHMRGSMVAQAAGDAVRADSAADTLAAIMVG